MTPIDNNVKDALTNAQRRLEERTQPFDDRGIGSAWTTLAMNERTVTVATKRGLSLTVQREAVGGRNMLKQFIPR